MNKKRTNIRLQLVLAWSAFSMRLEQLAALLFPAILFPVFFIAFALLGLFERFGDPIRLGFALLSFAGFWFFWLRGWGGFSMPSVKQVERRAETDGGARVGSLAVLRDQPERISGPDGDVLWAAHQQKTKDRIKALSVQTPVSVWVRRDKWAFRVLAFLMVFSGFVFAGAGWKARIDNAFYWGFLSGPEQNIQIEAWINPPEYAKRPPVFIVNEQDAPISALPGSEFVVRVTGARRAPKIRIEPNQGRAKKLTALGGSVFEGKIQISGQSELVLSGSAKTRWHIQALQDTPPDIAFKPFPKANEVAELSFGVQASDDFGINQVLLLINTETDGSFAKTDRIKITLPLGKTIDTTLEMDLTQHVLAGLDVQLILQAVDGAGQSSNSEAVLIKLPQKLFIKPLAKAVAEQRLLVLREQSEFADKKPDDRAPVLVGNDFLFVETPKQRLSRAPAKIQRSAALMGAVMRAPEQGINDPVVWLGLSYVHHRLYGARGQNDLSDLGPQLWQIALRAEGGELASAAAALKLAQKALQTALLLSDPPSEVQRLSQKYEMAVKRYLEALAKQALQDGETPANGAGNMMSADQLQEMLDALKALAETGANMDARTLLKALAAMLENLKMQMAGGTGGDGAQDDAISEAMRKALEELGDLLGEQKELLDETQRQQNNQTQNGNSTNTTGMPSQGLRELSGRQGKLQGKLNELGTSGALANSQAKQALGEAETAMEETAKAMGEGKAVPGLVAGQKALGQLRKGAEILAEEMLDRQEGKDQKSGRDPFGRASNSGSENAQGTQVPDVIDPQQARKILQELRRRAAEQKRERDELEYLDRLLERF